MATTSRSMNPFARIASAILLLSGLGGVIGCNSHPSYPTVKLAGEVTIAGQPVAEGKIVFLPQLASGPAVGVSITDGRYLCPAAPTGKLLVQIYAVRDTGKTIPVMGKSIPELINIVPPAARAGQTIEVHQDKLDLDFDL